VDAPPLVSFEIIYANQPIILSTLMPMILSRKQSGESRPQPKGCRMTANIPQPFGCGHMQDMQTDIPLLVILTVSLDKTSRSVIILILVSHLRDEFLRMADCFSTPTMAFSPPGRRDRTRQSCQQSNE
jgi:hypothetical protein